MKLENRKAKGNHLIFDLSGVEQWYVNTLRRAIQNEVPIMAIELVEFRKNDSVLYDEIVAHRLGLVPLTTDLESYKLADPSERSSKEYLAQSSCKLTLKAKGPSIVYAKDLKSKDPKIKPVFPDMPIVKLLDGQELEFEATAILYKGRYHVKWSAGHAHFKQLEKEGDFQFTLESWGQLKPADTITAAIEEYNKQLKEFDELVGSI